MGAIGLLAIVPAAISFWLDFEDREQQRIATAWELITRDVSGNSGKKPAIEYLNRLGEPLTGINIENSYLVDLQLPHANLMQANLNGANLEHANLTGANLSGATFRNANLTGANLSAANLNGTDLSGAQLVTTNLSDARFRRARLSGADLYGASLENTDFENACGSNQTNLPNGIKLQACDDVDQM